MTNRALDQKFEMTQRLAQIEISVAALIIRRRRTLTTLIKLKNYATMKECDFRDKQLKKLIGDKNG
tara:strand:+ start:288 stop:485 length:198 start_codon:yes stop_codon:yes gene_type:complete